MTPGATRQAHGSRSGRRLFGSRYSRSDSMAFLARQSGVQALLGFERQKEDVEDVRVGLGGRGRRQVRADADGKKPNLVQAKREGADARPQHQRDGPRQPREQHRLDQRAMKRHLQPLAPLRAHTSRPPENPRNPRPQLTALNAIARPSTTQSALRIIEPPSENAMPRPRPMMATAPTTLETGPVSESRICCSGPSQGMPPPRALLAPPKLPAWAVALERTRMRRKAPKRNSAARGRHDIAR